MNLNDDKEIIENLEEPKSKTEEKKKSRDEKLRDSFDLFGVDKDYDIDEELEVEVKIPKDTTDKILKTSRMFKEAVLKLKGYEETPKGEKGTSIYQLKTQPQAGSTVIKAFEQLLSTYCDESNLITKKSWDSYKIQAMASWDTFFKVCLRDKTTPEDKLRTVQNTFQDLLINVGEITCDNLGNMDKLFGTINNDKENVDRRNTFKDGTNGTI